MGFMSAIVECLFCHRPFSCNPDLVPSFTVNGRREPCCTTCLKIANEKRAEKNLPPFCPLPGAYESQEF